MWSNLRAFAKQYDEFAEAKQKIDDLEQIVAQLKARIESLERANTRHATYTETNTIVTPERRSSIPEQTIVLVIRDDSTKTTFANLEQELTLYFSDTVPKPIFVNRSNNPDLILVVGAAGGGRWSESEDFVALVKREYSGT